MVLINHHRVVFENGARVDEVIFDARRARYPNALIDPGGNGDPTSVANRGDRFSAQRFYNLKGLSI